MKTPVKIEKRGVKKSEKNSKLKYLDCKIPTYQLKRGTVPQVQGYRHESFEILTNPVGGKNALTYTTPKITLLKENWITRP